MIQDIIPSRVSSSPSITHQKGSPQSFQLTINDVHTSIYNCALWLQWVQVTIVTFTGKKKWSSMTKKKKNLSRFVTDKFPRQILWLSSIVYYIILVPCKISKSILVFCFNRFGFVRKRIHISSWKLSRNNFFPSLCD